MGKLHVSTDGLIFIIVGGLTVLALILIVFLATKESQGQNIAGLTTYKTNDVSRPEVRTTSSFSDLGSLGVKEEKTALFSLENVGTKPLQVFGIKSSCNCTFGQLTIDGKDSPEFSMHSQNSWVGTLQPNQKATLSVIYRPSLMPVKGEVTRQVFLETNDPQNQNLTFTIKATVL